MTLGTLYNYLAEGVGVTPGKGTLQAFRALSRGYNHWASGRIEEIKANLHNPYYSHVRCLIKPSMKSGIYRVYLLISNENLRLLKLPVNVQQGKLEENSNKLLITCLFIFSLTESQHRVTMFQLH